MEQLLKQALETIVHLGNDKPVALLSVKDKYDGMVVGGWVKGEFILPSKDIKFKGTPLEKIITTKEAHTYPGTVMESLPFPSYKETNSGFTCLCLPLLGENKKVKGVAVIAQKRGDPLSSDRLQALSTLTPLIAAVVEASIEAERLIKLATRDGLTELYTRHYFETRLQEEFTRVRRHGGVFSLLMVDVDHFKQINDTCGYKEGNRVLQELAKLLDNSIRNEIDIPCRYAGKKFLLLLPNTDVDGAYVLGDRIRRRCEQHRFATQQGIPLKVTLSIGIAHNVDIAHHDDDNNSTDIQEVSKEELIHRADLMLYAAKQAGRNQVMVWW
ncbi:sensor domain-containing diguanylate cyclase [Candidatus Parabeggiatoa sp. HSG14]|uniref:sensor domain-containing diguanylate cyclase n=1 Tax=Candidatus Parabeggiatoa sp. HSG14 TaxID=3055593 RepID=UPI0032E3A663